jgi:hypothetical protein
MNAVTPLHKTAKHGNLEIMQLLLNHDTVVNTLDHDDLAVARGRMIPGT